MSTIPKTSLDKRLSYLGIADFDYLSARLLMLHGLIFNALPKAAEAIEKLIKLFLVLEAKITRNEELTPEQLKTYGHNLPRLFRELKSKVPQAIFGADWDDYMRLLQDSYTKRYPEHWENWRIETSIQHLDATYTYLRNSVIMNFPPEEQEKVRHFGSFLYDIFTPEFRDRIRERGGRPPDEILRQFNDSFASLDINVNQLRPGLSVSPSMDTSTESNTSAQEQPATTR